MPFGFIGDQVRHMTDRARLAQRRDHRRPERAGPAGDDDMGS